MSDPIDPAVDQQPLAPPSKLRPLPPGFAAARETLHRLAEAEMSSARKAATGKIGLRATPGGFGTPAYGDGQQIRLEGTELVVVAGGAERVREPVEVDPDAAACLADWFALGADVLLELRAAAGAGAQPSMIQLWPEHFDLAIELGSDAGGARANYGFSPGDAEHPQPYAYVGPWVAPSPSELWQASGFPGAELGYQELLRAADHRAAALEFMLARLHALGVNG